MKLEKISNMMNLRTTVEFLTNAIHAGVKRTILNTEIGEIPVEIIPSKLQTLSDPECGVCVYRWDIAPSTEFVCDMIRVNSKNKTPDRFRWYMSIPYINGQSVNFTRIIVTRGLMRILIGEILADTRWSYDSYEISTELIDEAFVIFRNKHIFEYDSDVDFNNELCRLSVPMIKRMGSTYVDLMRANLQLLCRRLSGASKNVDKCLREFNEMFDDHLDPEAFGSWEFTMIFAAIVVHNGMSFRHYNPLQTYEYITSKYKAEETILPIALMKICLLDKNLKKGNG
ncbi:MAG: hypothetical protein NC548_13040 [Lachnospiraceae bacterium]|nr:hypothetical protein [Lachnospiraceae bacterium]MCM1230685.1 hypothetical protein [Ruminococcus flavefaciens]